MAATISYQPQIAQCAMTHDRGSGTAHHRRAKPRVSARDAAGARLTSPGTIQRLGRIVYAVLLFSVVLAVIISSVLRAEHPQPKAWTEVTVQQSGTLWALARAHPVTGLTTAETVELIKASNHLDSALITPGQALRVPAPDGTDTAVASR